MEAVSNYRAGMYESLDGVLVCVCVMEGGGSANH